MKNEAETLDTQAKKIAKDYLTSEGELLSVLMEMRRKRVFSQLNYSGIFDYCISELRLSRAQAYYFKSVAEKSEEVPELKKAIDQGVVTLSEARRIVSVVNKDNHEEWIEKAKTLSQVELEKEVTAVNPKAHTKEKIKPIAKDLFELKVTLDSEMEENINALREILSQKLGRDASLKDVIKWTSKVCRERFDPVQKAKRAISLGNAQKGNHTISKAIQHQVNLRDDRQCTHKDHKNRRCKQKRWLHFHHQIPISRGGLNSIDNLSLLCSAHHRLVHESLG